MDSHLIPCWRRHPTPSSARSLPSASPPLQRAPRTRCANVPFATSKEPSNLSALHTKHHLHARGRRGTSPCSHEFTIELTEGPLTCSRMAMRASPVCASAMSRACASRNARPVSRIEAEELAAHLRRCDTRMCGGGDAPGSRNTCTEMRMATDERRNARAAMPGNPP